MNKETDPLDEEEMLPEYDFTGAVRGKYARRYAEESTIIVLAPDVAKVFPTSEAVNEALRALVKIARQSVNSNDRG